MTCSKSILFLLVLLSGTNMVFGAGNPNQVKNLINPREWSFVENKGQLADQSGKQISDIKFYSYSGGSQIYCRPGKISFVFTKTESEKKESISEATGIQISDFPYVGVQNFEPLHRNGMRQPNSKFNTQNSKLTSNRLDLLLLNSNPQAQITATHCGVAHEARECYTAIPPKATYIDSQNAVFSYLKTLSYDASISTFNLPIF